MVVSFPIKKTWSRRFRHRHRRNPPLLGFFDKYGGYFQPTLAPPNCIPPGRFSLQREDDDDGCSLFLGCRHGLFLILLSKPRKVLVWDPITGDKHRIAVPAAFDMEKTQGLVNGAVLRPGGEDQHFQVVLAGVVGDDIQHVPVDMYGRSLKMMRAESGGLGCLVLSNCTAQLWKRKTDCGGVASWGLARTIELDKLLSLKSEDQWSLNVLGIAEENNVVFLWTGIGLFMIHLESLKFKNLFKTNIISYYLPFESVYTAEICAGGGGQDGADILLNT